MPRWRGPSSGSPRRKGRGSSTNCGSTDGWRNQHKRPTTRSAPLEAELFCSMAKLVFGMSQSLDGYVDHLELPRPDPALFRHFTEWVRDLTGSVYGRRLYEIMRYWDEDRP